MNRKVYKIFKTIEGDNMKKVWKGFAAAATRSEKGTTCNKGSIPCGGASGAI